MAVEGFESGGPQGLKFLGEGSFGVVPGHSGFEGIDAICISYQLIVEIEERGGESSLGARFYCNNRCSLYGFFQQEFISGDDVVENVTENDVICLWVFRKLEYIFSVNFYSFSLAVFDERIVQVPASVVTRI